MHKLIYLVQIRFLPTIVRPILHTDYRDKVEYIERFHKLWPYSDGISESTHVFEP